MTSLPDPAGIGMDHRLSGEAAISVGELRHIAEHVVYAIPGERVSLRHDGGASHLGTHLSAPYVGVGEEEILQFGDAIRSPIAEILALRLERVLQTRQRD